MRLRLVIDPDREALLSLADILKINLNELPSERTTHPGSGHEERTALQEWDALRARIVERVRVLAEHYRNS